METRASGRCLLVAATLASALLASGARAQTFAEQQWWPLPCGTQPMSDPWRDRHGALDERDLVGDQSAPAGLSASDGEFLYLRLRLDQDPAPDAALRPFAWGVGVSLDGDAASYELLLTVNGNSGQVELYQNTAVTRPDDPQDPADQPPVASYPFTSHGEVKVAPGSGYGDDPDYFIAFAVPWSALAPLGLTPLTPAALWAGSSGTANALNGDLACHDGGQGAPTLSGSASGSTIFDPLVDSDGDGYPDQQEVEAGTDPNDETSRPSGPAPGGDPLPGGVDLEGGGGCALLQPARPAAALVLVLGLGALLRARRRWQAR